MQDVILAFSRDPWVLRHSEVTLHEFVPIAEGVGRDSDSPVFNGDGAGGCCPPCGVQVRLVSAVLLTAVGADCC